MSDDVIVDGSLFFRARRARRPPRVTRPAAYSALLLHPDVSVGELVHALRQSTICVSTDATTGNQILHRRPGPKGAA